MWVRLTLPATPSNRHPDPPPGFQTCIPSTMIVAKRRHYVVVTTTLRMKVDFTRVQNAWADNNSFTFELQRSAAGATAFTPATTYLGGHGIAVPPQQADGERGEDGEGAGTQQRRTGRHGLNRPADEDAGRTWHPARLRFGFSSATVPPTAGCGTLGAANASTAKPTYACGLSAARYLQFSAFGAKLSSASFSNNHYG